MITRLISSPMARRCRNDFRIGVIAMRWPLALYLELGEYLAAESTYLLTRVVDVKPAVTLRRHQDAYLRRYR